MEVFVFDWWWTSHQSSAHKSTYLQILYCVWVRYTRTLAQTQHGKERLASRQDHNRRRAREGPEPVCVQTPFQSGVAHAGVEGWINIMPWYRLVGVAKNSSESRRRESWAAQKRVSGRHAARSRQAPPVPAQQPAVFRWQWVVAPG